jgi:hypothetical protein
MIANVIKVKIPVFIFLEFSVAKLATPTSRIVMKNSAFPIIFSEYSRDGGLGQLRRSGCGAKITKPTEFIIRGIEGACLNFAANNFYEYGKFTYWVPGEMGGHRNHKGDVSRALRLLQMPCGISRPEAYIRRRLLFG